MKDSREGKETDKLNKYQNETKNDFFDLAISQITRLS